MKTGTKSSLLLHPFHPGRYIDTNDRDSIKNIKIEILPSLPQLLAYSHTSGLASPSVSSLVTGLLMPIAVINCSFPLRHFHYSFPFNFFSCSIYSVGKYVTLCDTSVTESRHMSRSRSHVMSHIIWLGVRDSRCTDH